MTELPHTVFSRCVDTGLQRLGNAVSWVWLILLVVIVVNVVLRYLFAEGRIEFEEIQWHLYSAGFLMGMASAYTTDSHIRVDVLHERCSDATQAWIELYGILLLLLPFIALVIVSAIPFVEYSWATSEESEAPGGLAYRWAIKGMLLVGFVLLLLAAIARLTRVWKFLFGKSE
ncbi:MAG: TRAP transporter small permease subunit [Gammaproteobacteria bacterium]|nr:TRAP transporter small permease subunit [Gammaproteobacteria bacterium]